MQLRRGPPWAPFAVVVLLTLLGIGRAQEPPGERRLSQAAAPAPPEPDRPAPPRGPAKSSSSDIDGTVGLEIGGYADSDHVFVLTPSLTGAVSNPTAGWKVGGSYLVDAVSAASVDITSTASQRWTEVRHAGALDAAYKPGTFGVGANAQVSYEPDYLSLNAGGSVTQDLLDKNLTWLLSYNFGHDTAGRTGTPFSVLSHSYDRHAFKGGATIVLSRAAIASFVGDVIVEDGDQSKPYRFIPLFAPGTTVPVGASIDLVTRLRSSGRVAELLPLTRQRYAVSARLAYRGHEATLRFDERLYVDSWGLKATSTDARYLLDFGRIELGPHLRVHAQSPVDFWRRAYTVGPGFSYPAVRTGDRELGPLVNLTGGGSLEVALGPAGEPRAWVFGVDVNGMWTKYLDDLYVTDRVSTVGGLFLEAEL